MADGSSENMQGDEKRNREEVAKIIYRFCPNGPKAVSGNVSPVSRCAGGKNRSTKRPTAHKVVNAMQC